MPGEGHDFVQAGPTSACEAITVVRRTRRLGRADPKPKSSLLAYIKGSKFGRTRQIIREAVELAVRAYAWCFAREGYKVVRAGRSADKPELAVREIVDAGGEAPAVIGDASVEAVTRKTFPFGSVLECLLA
jgi:hypothetical protein